MLPFFASYAFLIGCSVLSVALAVAGVLFVRSFTSHETLKSHHGVAGPFLSITATIFAVVLGFIVVDSLNTFQRARLIVEQEANAIHDIFHMSSALSEPTRSNMREACMNYADAMVQFEWPAMEQGAGSPEGHLLFTRMWHYLTTYKPADASETTFLSQILDSMRTAGDCRHSRLLAAQPYYSPVLWLVLLLGSAITIIFTYFFGVENVRVQILMTALVTIVLSLNLSVVALFDTPFTGDVKVPPQAFVVDLNYFKMEMPAQ